MCSPKMFFGIPDIAVLNKSAEEQLYHWRKFFVQENFLYPKFLLPRIFPYVMNCCN